MCDKGLGESFKMHYEGPDSGNAKVTVPRSVLKHEIKAWAKRSHQLGVLKSLLASFLAFR